MTNSDDKSVANHLASCTSSMVFIACYQASHLSVLPVKKPVKKSDFVTFPLHWAGVLRQ